MDDLLRFLFEPADPPAVATLREWWAATERARAWPRSIDRAIAGGVRADRVGFAFAGGYAAALAALVPGTTGIAALCATEEGGVHPKAIRTRLESHPGGYRLTGTKKWATVASEAQSLFVVASTGVVDDRNRLRVVRVAANAPGVTIRPSTAAFVPEIPHAEVDFADVAVAEADVLPGDGYDDYVKPFRTVEDLHVHGALLGYLIGVARRHRIPREATERLVAVAIATRTLAHEDPRAATTHVALAGVIGLVTEVVGEVERAWPDGDERVRWQRDRGLLQVAGKARAARRERAWETLD